MVCCESDSAFVNDCLCAVWTRSWSNIQILHSLDLIVCGLSCCWSCETDPGRLCMSVDGNAGQVISDDLVNIIKVHLVQFLGLLFYGHR